MQGHKHGVQNSLLAHAAPHRSINNGSRLPARQHQRIRFLWKFWNINMNTWYQRSSLCFHSFILHVCRCVLCALQCSERAVTDRIYVSELIYHHVHILYKGPCVWVCVKALVCMHVWLRTHTHTLLSTPFLCCVNMIPVPRQFSDSIIYRMFFPLLKDHLLLLTCTYFVWQN